MFRFVFVATVFLYVKGYSQLDTTVPFIKGYKWASNFYDSSTRQWKRIYMMGGFQKYIPIQSKDRIDSFKVIKYSVGPLPMEQEYYTAVKGKQKIKISYHGGDTWVEIEKSLVQGQIEFRYEGIWPEIEKSLFKTKKPRY